MKSKTAKYIVLEDVIDFLEERKNSYAAAYTGGEAKELSKQAEKFLEKFKLMKAKYDTEPVVAVQE